MMSLNKREERLFYFEEKGIFGQHTRKGKMISMIIIILHRDEFSEQNTIAVRLKDNLFFSQNLSFV